MLPLSSEGDGGRFSLKKLFIALVFSVLLCGCNAAKQTTAAASCNNTTWNGTFSGVSQGGMQPLTLTINGDSFTGTLGGSPISGPVSYCAGEGTTFTVHLPRHWQDGGRA